LLLEYGHYITSIWGYNHTDTNLLFLSTQLLTHKTLNTAGFSAQRVAVVLLVGQICPPLGGKFA